MATSPTVLNDAHIQAGMRHSANAFHYPDRFPLQRLNGLTVQRFFENAQPIPAQNFFDINVAESALDQSTGEIARMRMIR